MAKTRDYLMPPLAIWCAVYGLVWLVGMQSLSGVLLHQTVLLTHGLFYLAVTFLGIPLTVFLVLVAALQPRTERRRALKATVPTIALTALCWVLAHIILPEFIDALATHSGIGDVLPIPAPGRSAHP
jgi:hypothetical protein